MTTLAFGVNLWLKERQNGKHQESRFSLDIQGDGQYEPTGYSEPDSMTPDDYECPKCLKVLFTDHARAGHFLREVPVSYNTTIE